jgi:hypothetical protein
VWSALMVEGALVKGAMVRGATGAAARVGVVHGARRSGVRRDQAVTASCVIRAVGRRRCRTAYTQNTRRRRAPSPRIDDTRWNAFRSVGMTLRARRRVAGSRRTERCVRGPSLTVRHAPPRRGVDSLRAPRARACVAARSLPRTPAQTHRAQAKRRSRRHAWPNRCTATMGGLDLGIA